MGLSLIQYRTASGQRAVAALDQSGRATRVRNAARMYDLANGSISCDLGLDQAARELGGAEDVDLLSLVQEERLLAPIDHAEPARLYLTGTGLTHLGSAETRDSMHRAAANGSAQTDSMRLFLMGLEGGKPVNGGPGVQPEWFYKGNGACVARPGGPIVSPSFARDGGEEPEIAGVYLIAPDGTPVRLGFCLANEFSDHVTERGNYLWLAHSKLRQAAFGPELLTGPLPEHIHGTSRILRNGVTTWEKPFLSGEANMSHSIHNLEQHHFKYSFFRRPGDVHVHFFGTATLSFADGIRAEPGDVFEIEAEPFRLPLRNVLAISTAEEVRVRSL
ncbi:MAG: AraD1 family protein [Terracidiphilus sp.]